MPTCSATPRAELEQEVIRLLDALGLECADSPEHLKKHFRSIIKKHHPDQSQSSNRLAHRRSQEIITAHQRLLQIIEAFPSMRQVRPTRKLTPLQTITSSIKTGTRIKTASRHPIESPSSNRKPHQVQSLQFQLFESREACYAIPLKAIERITATGLVSQNDSAVLQNTCYRPVYCNGMEPHYLEAGQIHWPDFRFVVLLKQAGSQILGLALAREIEPGKIIQIDPGQASIYNPGGRNPGLFFSNNNRHYFCPDDLAFQFLTQPGS